MQGTPEPALTMNVTFTSASGQPIHVTRRPGLIWSDCDMDGLLHRRPGISAQDQRGVSTRSGVTFIVLTMDTRERASNSILITSGAIALHVVDDNIVQPDWGGIGSHLFSAGVPLAVLVGLVYVWPRCRDGARAAITL